MVAPRKGKEVRQIVTIRLEPLEKQLLKDHFGGVQAAIDSVLTTLKNEKITKTEKLGSAINEFKKLQKAKTKES